MLAHTHTTHTHNQQANNTTNTHRGKKPTYTRLISHCAPRAHVTCKRLINSLLHYITLRSQMGSPLCNPPGWLGVKNNNPRSYRKGTKPCQLTSSCRAYSVAVTALVAPMYPSYLCSTRVPVYMYLCVCMRVCACIPVYVCEGEWCIIVTQTHVCTHT